MANGICDICKRRPASFRAQVSVNGDRQMMELCDDDYRKLARQQQRSSSPLESLFGGGSIFDEFSDNFDELDEKIGLADDTDGVFDRIADSFIRPERSQFDLGERGENT